MSHILRYKLFEDYESGLEVTIKKDSALFHATGEEFEPTTLGTGMDGLCWTCQQAGIAQTYIPEAGSTLLTSLEHIALPSKDPTLQNLQRKIGIEYDYSQVKWQADQRHTQSYRQAPVFDYIENEEKTSYYDKVEKMCQYVGNKLKSIYGYEPYKENGQWFQEHWYKLKCERNQVMPADYKMKGRLFVIKPKEDLVIYDMTEGGKKDPDLGDLDYNKLDLFEKIEKEGYDGVKITDFAQTKEYGNLGHLSVGLFNRGLKKCEWEVVPDATYPGDLERMMKDGDWDTAEYKMFKKLIDVKEVSESGPSKVVKEIKLYKEVNPRVFIIINTDQNNRITDMRNPSGIRFPFHLNWVLNKHALESWMSSNGFKKEESQTNKPLKGHELVKYIMKKGYF